jgi:hypothetical protein
LTTQFNQNSAYSAITGGGETGTEVAPAFGPTEEALALIVRAVQIIAGDLGCDPWTAAASGRDDNASRRRRGGAAAVH